MTFCKVQVYKISQRTEEMLQTLFTLHVPFPTQWGLHPGLSRTEGGGVPAALSWAGPLCQGTAAFDEDHPITLPQSPKISAPHMPLRAGRAAERRGCAD